MKAVIVTGSRNWLDSDTIDYELELAGPDLVIHGDCDGADRAAAMAAGSAALPMPAQWDRDGKAAGPIRNQHMLDVLLALGRCGYEIAVLAFPLPDSKGTWDMVNRARKAGVRVEVYGEEQG